MSTRIVAAFAILILIVFAILFFVFKTYFFSGTLDRARVTTAPDSGTSVSAVHRMLAWYKKDQGAINSLPLLGIMEGMSRISVDTVSTRKYLHILRRSGMFTSGFITRKSAFFEQVEQRLASTNQSDGQVDGMENDFLLFPLVAAQRVEDTLLPMRIVSSGKGDSALLEVEAIDHRLLIRVKMTAGKCKVDDIRWGGAMTTPATVVDSIRDKP